MINFIIIEFFIVVYRIGGLFCLVIIVGCGEIFIISWVGKDVVFNGCYFVFFCLFLELL